MENHNEVRLRPRFYKDLDENIDSVREKFVNYKKNLPSDFFMKVRGNYIQFTIIGDKQKYWSPHLTIELEEKEGSNGQATHIRGLFGPAQTLWTFFIFLHFIVAGLFLVFMMFAYSNYTLNKPVTSNIIGMSLMVMVWLLLYFFGRQTRANGYEQMDELEQEFLKAIK